jgi:hypothetical protein
MMVGRQNCCRLVNHVLAPSTLSHAARGLLRCSVKRPSLAAALPLPLPH